ncbi:hypothetical protein [Oceanobacillus saliphilus]|nr:hypothetical protein [Oceanobacillus saliphilus]
MSTFFIVRLEHQPVNALAFYAVFSLNYTQTSLVLANYIALVFAVSVDS